MSTRPVCPNCTEPVAKHPENGCVLATFIETIRGRGTVSERKLRKLHAECDADALWNRLGPIVDDLEEGRFSK
jgi:hypothetical protein